MDLDYSTIPARISQTMEYLINIVPLNSRSNVLNNVIYVHQMAQVCHKFPLSEIVQGFEPIPYTFNKMSGGMRRMPNVKCRINLDL